MKTLKTEVFVCKRCDYEWLQRHIVKRYIKGEGRIKGVISERPKNCSHCKSPSWDKARA
jgi:hypothetical protein